VELLEFLEGAHDILALGEGLGLLAELGLGLEVLAEIQVAEFAVDLHEVVELLHVQLVGIVDVAEILLRDRTGLAPAVLDLPELREGVLHVALLLDEVLQVLDDGRLTDGSGRTVDFKNTVLILTSNLGSEDLLNNITSTGDITDEAREKVMQAVRRHFKPEFLNRLDDIVIFQPLTYDNLRDITRLQIAEVAKRLQAVNRNTLEADDKAIDFILKESYDPNYGARPIRRYIEKSLVTQLSRLLISGTVPDRSTIRITSDGTKLSFVPIARPPSPAHDDTSMN